MLLYFNKSAFVTSVCHPVQCSVRCPRDIEYERGIRESFYVIVYGLRVGKSSPSFKMISHTCNCRVSLSNFLIAC